MGLKKNFIYSGILTTANYIFPLITFPYTSRVLGVTNIGICNFVDSIIQYFILFSFAMGAVAIREIAKYKNEKEKLNKVFNSLFVINAISTFIVLFFLIVAILLIPQLYEHKELMFIGALKLIFNFLLIEWLYKGLEDFKFITSRTLMVRCLYVISVFLFVRDKNDYPVYYGLLVGTIIVNAIINLFYAKRIVHFSFRNLELKSYVVPVLSMGLYNIITSMYTTFNVVFLGFVKTETDVGYYTTALKLYSIILSLFTAFTGVLLPRMSSLLSDNKWKEFNVLIEKSVKVLLFFSIPVVLIFIAEAPSIVLLIAGGGYEGSILPMRVIAPLIFIVGYELILVHQILIPLKLDKVIIRTSVVGAVVGVFLNMILVPKLASVGSSISWIVSEILILILIQYYLGKKLKMSFPSLELLKTVIVYVPFAFVVWGVAKMNISIMYEGGFIALFSISYMYFLYKIRYKNILLRN